MKVILQKKILIYAIILSIFLLIFDSADVITAVTQSITLCITSIIPSLFPFMVLSGALISLTDNSSFRRLEKVCKKFLGISPSAVTAVICGWLCGFPVGAKCTAQLYRQKCISGSDAEILLTYTNIPGPMFVIGVVGIGMFHSFKIGIMLYLIQIFSALCIGITIGKNSAYTLNKINSYDKTKTDFSKCVCESVTNTLNVCGFVLFFSAVTELIKPFASVFPEAAEKLIISVTEMVNGIKCISQGNLTLNQKLAFTSFALGWSGVSVHLQIKALLHDTGISMKKYYISKIFAGVFSALITYIPAKYSDDIIILILNSKNILWMIIAFLIVIAAKIHTVAYRAKKIAIFER